uniref:Sigma factor n=1 Tax=Erodium chrysanthum TaxID=337364 RepID=A0A0G2STP8_9ROSI|nr:sigma factor [Erodium chrysanthum]
MGLRLNLKWDFPIHSHPLPTSPFKLPASPESRCQREPLKAYTSSSLPPQTLDNDLLQVEDMKIKKRSYSSLNLVGDGLSGLQASKPAQFNLLMENLSVLEETFADSNVLRLERDILQQLGKLGALKLFDTCLPSNVFDLSEDIKDIKSSTKDRVFVPSVKKEKRKSGRERVLGKGKKISNLSLTMRTKEKASPQPSVSSAKRASHSRSKRLMVEKHQVEMAKGVKVMMELERIRATLEEATGQIARLSCWAEAAGLEQKVLRQQLHFGWRCRDEILRSSRTLVMYLARYYRRPGVAIEELLQAGNLGILEGAKRFDPDRGCKFSTYAQHWIRKSMSTVVAQSTRDVHIPYKLRQTVYEIRKAERALKNGHQYPNNAEISKFTGLSLAKIELARRYSRIVGSIDQKVGYNHDLNILDITPDTSIPSPVEIAMRAHMRKDIHTLLDSLELRESQVLILRFGLDDHRPRSLGETGELCRVSKAWVRKVENKAMTKLRGEEMAQNLRHYLVYMSGS